VLVLFFKVRVAVVTFKSYSQNLEDVMLWRALGKYEKGFYIDVGACDPVADSVTKAFYDAGWRGINIEPMASAYALVSEHRPRDINLNIAIDIASGVKEFYSVDAGNGLSTSVSEYASAYKEEGRIVESVSVETRTLAEVCNAYVNQEIHFLKVDVEGGEASVLQSADFTKFRPWIVLVEATKPNTQIPSHQEWEPLLLEAGYKFVYFDGLNRFYVAEEKYSVLSDKFSVPPNWFDGYERRQNIDLQEQVAVLNSNLSKFEFPEHVDGASVVVKAEFVLDSYNQLVSSTAEKEGSLRAELERAKLELESCYQEIYESSRHIGHLTRERLNALSRVNALESKVLVADEVVDLRQRVSTLQSDIDLIRHSTSWRVMAPVRKVVNIIQRLGGRK
jgi:FkbM family methyltransferase